MALGREPKTVAEHILDVVNQLQLDVEEIKRRLGEQDMEPINSRLKRLETKIHAIGDGTFKQGDGMQEKY